MEYEKKSKILIIDDEKMNVISLAGSLKQKYEVIVAMNGAEGLEAAEQQLPDIILLDVVMPEMTGFEVLVKLKSIEATKDIPVFLITGLDSDIDEEKGLLLGASDYITKPFNKEVLKKRIETHLRLAAYIREDTRINKTHL